MLSIQFVVKISQTSKLGFKRMNQVEVNLNGSQFLFKKLSRFVVSKLFKGWLSKTMHLDIRLLDKSQELNCGLNIKKLWLQIAKESENQLQAM